MTHSELVGIGHRWLLKSKGCGFAFAELCASMSRETPDVIGWRDGVSILVECKVNRNDFLSDKKKSFRINPQMGMGAFRFYMCPEGLIGEKDLPEKWGLVWVYGKKKAIQRVGPRGNCFWNGRSEFYHKRRNWRAEMALMQSALRRIHIRGLLSCIYDRPPKREDRVKW